MCPVQAGGHVDVVEVNGEVYDDSLFECKDRVPGVSVEFVLSDGVFDILAGELVFEFHRYDGNAVYEEDDIETVLIYGGVAELPGAVEDVLFVAFL